MKKIITAAILTITILFIPFGTNAHAANVYRTDAFPNKEVVVYQDNDFTITEIDTQETFTGINQTFSAKSAKKQKSFSRVFNIKSSTGKLLATFTLNATFVYDGKTASCTKSSYSTQIKDKNVSFTSTSSSKSGSTATGKYTLKIKSTRKAISRTVSVTCSKSGVIS